MNLRYAYKRNPVKHIFTDLQNSVSKSSNLKLWSLLHSTYGSGDLANPRISLHESFVQLFLIDVNDR